MKDKSEKTVARTAYTKPLDKPVSYTFTWKIYEDKDEVPAPTPKQLREYWNAKAKAKARQEALVAALTAAGIEKPTLENDEQFRLQQMYKILVASGKSEDEARDLASTTLGIEWADEDE